MSQQTITFHQHSSAPAKVARLHQENGQPHEDQLGPDEVHIRFLAAPINPQDLMVIAGKYPVQPEHRHAGEPIPGYDGVARVERVGSAVDVLAPGNHVVPRTHGLGTWRSHATVPASSLLRVSATLDPIAASLLKMGCGPAYLLLNSAARELRPGDWVVLNAAKGVIAQLTIQFAKLRGCHSIGVLRDRDDVDSSRQQLRALGADAVVTESELAAPGALTSLAQGKRIKLALDAVFGEPGARLAALLSPGATYVNYGSLGGAGAVSIPLTQELIFWKQITFKNFRLSQALSQYSQPEQEDLLAYFGSLFESGSLQTPAVDRVAWESGPRLEEVVLQALEDASGQSKRPVGARKKVFYFV